MPYHQATCFPACAFAMATLVVLAACGGGGEAGGTADIQSVPSAERAQIAAAGSKKPSTAVVAAARAGVRSIELQWNDDGKSAYKAYVSRSPDCNPQDPATCTDLRVVDAARSPATIGNLTTDDVYYAGVQLSGPRGETSLSPALTARPNVLSFNGTVEALTATPGGATYLGGSFSRVGILSGRGLTVDAIYGTAANANANLIADGVVHAAVPDGSGGTFVGGDFTVPGTSRRNLVHIRADGSIDPAFNPAVDGTVYAVGVLNGTVYIGGAFNYVSGQFRGGLGAVDMAGSITAWNPSPTPGGALANAIHNGRIYVGGPFGVINGQYRNGLAALDAAGSVQAWDPKLDINSVSALHVANNKLYAGGRFTRVGNAPRAALASFDVGGTGALTAWNANAAPCACQMHAIASAGSAIYVAGAFASYAGQARSALMALDASSAAVLPWSPKIEGAAYAIGAVSDAAGTRIYVGGSFDKANGTERANAAAFDATGKLMPWNPAPDSTVNAVAPSTAGVYLGGEFKGMYSQARRGLAAYGSDGELSGWSPKVDGQVNEMVWANGALHVGGRFDGIDGQPRKNLAVVMADGSLSPLRMDTDGEVMAMAQGPSGRIYVGGYFSMLGTETALRLGAYLPTGERAPWWPSVFGGPVYAIAVRPESAQSESVYVGGSFGAVNLVARSGAARIEYDGAVHPWTATDVTVEMNSEYGVTALAAVPGGVYVGKGRLSALSSPVGFYTDALFRFDDEGRALPTDRISGSVLSLMASGNSLYVGGAFSSINGTATRINIAQLDAAAGVTGTWNPGVGSRSFGAVRSMSMGSNGLRIGGYFTTANGKPASNFWVF